MVNFTMEKMGRYHLSQGDKVNTTLIRHINSRYPQNDAPRVSSVASSPKAQNLNPVRRKHQTNSIEIFYKITDWYSSKLSQAMKTKKERSCHRLEETKETNNQRQSGIWNRTPGETKDISGKTGEAFKLQPSLY